MGLPERLRLWRHRKNITQTEAAEALGVPLRTYANWEYGKRTPTEMVRRMIDERLKRWLSGGAQEEDAMSRRMLKALGALREHAWYGPRLARLSIEEALICRNFCDLMDSQGADKGTVEQAINRMWLDVGTKPKNWSLVSEILSAANNTEEPAK